MLAAQAAQLAGPAIYKPAPEAPYTGSFREFVDSTDTGFEWYSWNADAAGHLQQVADDEERRLLIFAPPSHGKSELVSRKFSAYYLRRHPERFVGLSSYGAHLAYRLSRAARNNFERGGGSLDKNSRAVDAWYTTGGGGMWACGRGGAATGFHYHLGLIDDPLKDHKEAASQLVLHDLREWYDSVWDRRQMPEAAQVYVFTRWTESDVAGIVSAMEAEAPQRWKVLVYEAIKTNAVFDFPATIRIVKDGRKEGEALCPERYPLAKLEQAQGRMQGYWWNCLYQQRPEAGTGKGRIYHSFEPSEYPAGNVSTAIADPGGDVYVGMDFNVDPMTFHFASRAGDQYHVWGYGVIADNSGTFEACQEIARRFHEPTCPATWAEKCQCDHEGRGRNVTVCPDPSGRARHTSSGGRTDFSIIESFGFTVEAPRAAPPVVDRINSVNLMLESGSGDRRLLISASDECRPLRQALLKHTYKPNTSIPDKTLGYDHHTDNLGYAVHALFPASWATAEVSDLRLVF